MDVNFITEWPRCWCNTEVTYSELDAKNKEIVKRHLKIAGEMNIWKHINSLLMDKFYEKKSEIIKNKHIPTDLITKHYYEKYLLMGKSKITNIDIYPCSFQSYLESILYGELTQKNFNYICVYYGDDGKPEELKFDTFDKNDWLLSNREEMTSSDINVMKKYKSGFLLFLDKCVNMLSYLKNTKCVEYKYEIVKEEQTRIINQMIVPS